MNSAPSLSRWLAGAPVAVRAATGIAGLLRAIDDAGLALKDIHTSQSSLEEIFINLVKAKS